MLFRSELIAKEDQLRYKIENLVKTKVPDAFCKITFDASYVVVD